MTEPLTLWTGDRVAFADVLVARDAGVAYLVSGEERRRVVASAPRQFLDPHREVARHLPAARATSTDRYSPLRERMMRLGGGGYVLLGILVGPLVMAGYVALTVLLFLPLLALRSAFRARSNPAVAHGHNEGHLWDAATGKA